MPGHKLEILSSIFRTIVACISFYFIQSFKKTNWKYIFLIRNRKFESHVRSCNGQGPLNIQNKIVNKIKIIQNKIADKIKIAEKTKLAEEDKMAEKKAVVPKKTGNIILTSNSSNTLGYNHKTRWSTYSRKIRVMSYYCNAYLVK